MFSGELGEHALDMVSELNMAQDDETRAAVLNKRRGSTGAIKEKKIEEVVERKLSASRTPIGRHLDKFSADYIAPETQRYLNDTMIVQDLINSLARNKLHGMAVCNAKTLQLTGVVDMQDFLHHIIMSIPVGIVRKLRTPKALDTLNEEDSKLLKVITVQLSQVKLNAIKSASGCNPFVPISKNAFSTEIIELFATGVHQAPVLGSNKTYRSSIHHLSILRLIVAQFEVPAFEHFKNYSIKKVGWDTLPVVTISSNTLVLCAMELLYLYRGKTDILGIVNDQGKLIGSFSAQDLVLVFEKKAAYFDMLYSLETFLRKKKRGTTLATCTHTDTVGHILQICAERRSMHMWLLGEKGQPQSCISTVHMFELLQAKFMLQTDSSTENISLMFRDENDPAVQHNDDTSVNTSSSVDVTVGDKKEEIKEGSKVTKSAADLEKELEESIARVKSKCALKPKSKREESEEMRLLNEAILDAVVSTRISAEEVNSNDDDEEEETKEEE